MKRASLAVVLGVGGEIVGRARESSLPSGVPMQKRPWFLSLKVLAASLALLGSGCSRNQYYETEVPTEEIPPATVQAQPDGNAPLRSLP